MAETFKTRLRRWSINLFPAYWSTGARVIYLADDWREARVKLPLSWRTRNLFGTIFGGSMYAAVDPIYAVMLVRLLGPRYSVWDKAAAIRFRKPGRGALYAHFNLRDEDLDALRAEVEQRGAIERVYQVELTDDHGVVHATIEKTIHIRAKRPASEPSSAPPAEQRA
jgi:acyl-coenzyme A thioesterase PaaI-like protein